MLLRVCSLFIVYKILLNPVSQAGRQAIQNNYMRPARTPSPNGLPSGTSRRSALSLRPQTSSQSDRDYDPPQRIPSPAAHRSQSRTGLPSRPASPANSTRSFPSSSSRPRDAPPSRNRPPSSSSQIQSSTVTVRSGQARRPSNVASTSSQAPLINLPTVTSRPTPANARGPSSDVNQTLLVSRAPLDVPFTPASVYTPSPGRSRPASPTSSDPFLKQSTRSGVAPGSADTQPSRRDHNARVSFFDPANQAALDRLIAGAAGGQNDVEGEEESTQATMANVEEMIEGYEWASDEVNGSKPARGAADLIEARLLDELMALEKVKMFL